MKNQTNQGRTRGAQEKKQQRALPGHGRPTRGEEHESRVVPKKESLWDTQALLCRMEAHFTCKSQKRLLRIARSWTHH